MSRERDTSISWRWIAAATATAAGVATAAYLTSKTVKSRQRRSSRSRAAVTQPSPEPVLEDAYMHAHTTMEDDDIRAAQAFREFYLDLTANSVRDQAHAHTHASSAATSTPSRARQDLSFEELLRSRESSHARASELGYQPDLFSHTCPSESLSPLNSTQSSQLSTSTTTTGCTTCLDTLTSISCGDGSVPCPAHPSDLHTLPGISEFPIVSSRGGAQAAAPALVRDCPPSAVVLALAHRHWLRQMLAAEQRQPRRQELQLPADDKENHEQEMRDVIDELTDNSELANPTSSSSSSPPSLTASVHRLPPHIYTRVLSFLPLAGLLTAARVDRYTALCSLALRQSPVHMTSLVMAGDRGLGSWNEYLSGVGAGWRVVMPEDAGDAGKSSGREKYSGNLVYEGNTGDAMPTPLLLNGGYLDLAEATTRDFTVIPSTTETTDNSEKTSHTQSLTSSSSSSSSSSPPVASTHVFPYTSLTSEQWGRHGSLRGVLWRTLACDSEADLLWTALIRGETLSTNATPSETLPTAMQTLEKQTQEVTSASEQPLQQLAQPSPQQHVRSAAWLRALWYAQLAAAPLDAAIAHGIDKDVPRTLMHRHCRCQTLMQRRVCLVGEEGVEGGVEGQGKGQDKDGKRVKRKKRSQGEDANNACISSADVVASRSAMHVSPFSSPLSSAMSLLAAAGESLFTYPTGNVEDSGKNNFPNGSDAIIAGQTRSDMNNDNNETDRTSDDDNAVDNLDKTNMPSTHKHHLSKQHQQQHYQPPKPLPNTPCETCIVHADMALTRLLSAYAVLDPGVGYCQALNFVCGMALTVLPEWDALAVAAALLNGFGRKVGGEVVHAESLLKARDGLRDGSAEGAVRSTADADVGSVNANGAVNGGVNGGVSSGGESKGVGLYSDAFVPCYGTCSAEEVWKQVLNGPGDKSVNRKNCRRDERVCACVIAALYGVLSNGNGLNLSNISNDATSVSNDATSVSNDATNARNGATKASLLYVDASSAAWVRSLCGDHRKLKHATFAELHSASVTGGRRNGSGDADEYDFCNDMMSDAYNGENYDSDYGFEFDILQDEALQRSIFGNGDIFDDYAVISSPKSQKSTQKPSSHPNATADPSTTSSSAAAAAAGQSGADKTRQPDLRLPEENAQDRLNRVLLSNHEKSRRRALSLRIMFTPTLAGMQIARYIFSELLRLHLPAIFTHFANLRFPIDLFTEWFMTMFAMVSVPHTTAARIWDYCICRGPKSVYRIALAVLASNEKRVLNMTLEEIHMFFRHEKPDCFYKPDLLIEIGEAFKITNRIVEEMQGMAIMHMQEHGSKLPYWEN